MYATDFEYAGQFLSDFGFIVCNFDGDKGWESISAGSEITFNKVSKNQGKVHSLTDTRYNNCMRHLVSGRKLKTYILPRMEYVV